jgi:hypothetical protein
MRDATDIQLDQLIVHILDSGHSNGLVLSQRTLPLDREPRLMEYFLGHIKNSLQDPAATAARFVALDGETTAAACRALVEGSLELVEGSRRLAQELYKIIAADRRISAGDLAVCLYRAGNYPHIPRYLALLKLDPSEVFRHKTERDSQGHLYVRFELEGDVLPTTRERLQKCAFVQPLDPRPGYDMMLLDRQVRPPVPRPVAKFFSEDFLGTEPAFDARKRTDTLYRGLVSARNQLHLQLKAEEDEALRQAIDTAVRSAFINMDAWIEALPLSAKCKEHIDQVVSQELPDREFEVDTTYLQELSRKRRFRGDHGLRVEVSADRYSQVIQSVEPKNEPGVPPYYRVVIHTERWEEVPR